jgi:hypothetical protein
MPLPEIPLPSDTVEVGGTPVRFRSLSRREAMRLVTEFQHDPDAAETFVVACGCGVTTEEAEAWREATDPAEAGKLVDGIILLTGLASDAEGRDPNSSASAPSSPARSTPSSSSSPRPSG